MSDGVVVSVIAAHTVYCQRVLGLSGGQTAILTNGRVSHAVYWCMQNSIPLDCELLFFYQIPTVNGAKMVLLVVLPFLKLNFTKLHSGNVQQETSHNRSLIISPSMMLHICCRTQNLGVQ